MESFCYLLNNLAVNSKMFDVVKYNKCGRSIMVVQRSPKP